MLPAGAENERSFTQRQHRKYERSRRRQHAFPPENYDCRGAARPGGELGLGGKLKDLMAVPKMLTESVGGSRA